MAKTTVPQTHGERMVNFEQIWLRTCRELEATEEIGRTTVHSRSGRKNLHQIPRQYLS